MSPRSAGWSSPSPRCRPRVTSLHFVAFFTAFLHCLFAAFSLPFHCLSLPFRCLFTAFSLPFTAPSLPALRSSEADPRDLRRLRVHGFPSRALDSRRTHSGPPVSCRHGGGLSSGAQLADLRQAAVDGRGRRGVRVGMSVVETLPFLRRLTADSLPFLGIFTAFSLPFHCLSLTDSLPFHCLFTAFSWPTHCLFTVFHMHFHCLSLCFHLPQQERFSP